MSMQKITLTNDFHNTSINVIVDGEPDDIEYRLSDSRVRRIRRTLCGMSECSCGSVRCDEWQMDDCPAGAATLINRHRDRANALHCGPVDAEARVSGCRARRQH